MAGLRRCRLRLLPLLLAVAGGIKLPVEVPGRVAQQVRAQLNDPEDRVEVLPVDAKLPAETFEVRCGGDGRTTVRGGSRLAALFGVYDLALAAGYGFLHPLYVVEASSPPDWCHSFEGHAPQPAGGSGDRDVAAAAVVRGTHLHTQHPIELADLLNGVGPALQGRGKSEDEAAWATGLPMWTSYLQWLVANKQNLVEWALLEWTSPDASFSMSPVRHRRLSELVAMAQEWGLQVSIDAPINLQQQHAFRLQAGQASSAFMRRLEWLCSLGLDMVSTEIGSTEFSKTDPTQTVELLNTTVAYLASKGKHLVVKNHASTQQLAKGYPDPIDPSKDLNFNYITYYADKRVVSAPHTVQMYSLADPLVGSYGRRSLEDIRAMMRLLDQEGKPQVFFPETSYWVDFDNSVPLFLPLYATDRLRDLQILAREAPRAGHLNFESGWAFGYWINNAAQAYAAWHRGADSQGPLTAERLFSALLDPLGKPGADLADLLLQLAELQNQTLVHDVFEGPFGEPQTLVGYLEGWEGMAELQEAWQLAVVQPPRVHPRDISIHGPWYLEVLAPRLRALAEAALPFADRCRDIRTDASENSGANGRSVAALLQDACVGVELFALRAKQAVGIYAAASGAAPEKGLKLSAAAIRDGLSLIESLNLAPEWTEWSGVSWPTSYPYGYLWPAATLFFWRRDHQIVASGIREACYLNLYDPVELGLPFSGYKSHLKGLARFLSSVLHWMPWIHTFAGCLTGPQAEPILDEVYALETTPVPMTPIERPLL